MVIVSKSDHQFWQILLDILELFLITDDVLVFRHISLIELIVHLDFEMFGADEGRIPLNNFDYLLMITFM